jgi:predicted nuclease of predicted toxin-antitoxin system
MKLLLDECTPRRLKHEFINHECWTVDDAGLKGFENGELLQAASVYDVLITVDRKLVREHDMSRFNVAVLLLVARSNRYEDLKPLVPRALQALARIMPGQVVEIIQG